jgi:hypothetical protein
MNIGHRIDLAESRRCAAAGAALTVVGTAVAALADPVAAAVVAAGGLAATFATVRLELTRR